MSFEIDKNKRVENSNLNKDTKSSKDVKNATDKKINQYFNSKDDIVSADDFDEIHRSFKSFNSVFETYKGQKWDSDIKSEFDTAFQKDITPDLTEPVDALRVEKPVIIDIPNNKIGFSFKLPKAKVTKNTNITTKFNGTAEDLNKYLANTPLKGLGQHFIDVQEKYGVNALFLMGIIKTESGYGNAPAKGTKYNLAGLKRAKKYGGGYQKPKSFAESVEALGSTIKRLYIKSGKITPDKVQRGGYCPGNPEWTNRVIEEWNNINDSIAFYDK